jgi:molybdopterin molybdotransferase
MGSCHTQGLQSLDHALEHLLSRISALTETENLPLPEALGRITAEAIHSPINVPDFANSAMDGYAIKSADLMENTPFIQIGKAFAGQGFNGEMTHQQCVRIMTGAPIPDGADAVIMQEEAMVDGDIIRFTRHSVQQHENIRPLGDDLKKGQLVIDAGCKITARDMPLLASLGIPTVKVIRQPVVAFFSTGDELVSLGEPLQSGQIYDSNRYGVAALLQKLGCKMVDLGILPDDLPTLRQAVTTAIKNADVLITSGGVSVGEADHTKTLLDEMGRIEFWKLAIKPGKPFAFGEIDNTWFCGLPGNPVSAMVTFYQLVQPMLAKLSGHTAYQSPLQLPAIANTAFKKQPGRIDFQRGIFRLNDQGQLCVESTGHQGSGAFHSMHQANCFVVLEQERGRVEKGETVTIELFNSAFE